MSVQEQIENALTQLLTPVVLDVVNESSQHNVPPNSETQVKVVIVSEQFVGRRKVARHQQVYGAVAEQLAGPVHALALHTYTPQEWQEQGVSPESPNCMGGSKGEDL
jgi:stress-induced morphogen